MVRNTFESAWKGFKFKIIALLLSSIWQDIFHEYFASLMKILHMVQLSTSIFFSVMFFFLFYLFVRSVYGTARIAKLRVRISRNCCVKEISFNWWDLLFVADTLISLFLTHPKPKLSSQWRAISCKWRATVSRKIICVQYIYAYICMYIYCTLNI